jgi:hypothetical protein
MIRIPFRSIFCAAALAMHVSAHAAPHDTEFREALGSYKSARYSEAFGRLMSLAGRGDSDAARIVLFMHQYGPSLYGSYWDLNPDEVLQFQQVAALATHRSAPVFKPVVVPRPVSTRNAAGAATTVRERKQ